MTNAQTTENTHDDYFTGPGEPWNDREWLEDSIDELDDEDHEWIEICECEIDWKCGLCKAANARHSILDKYDPR